MGLKIYNKMLKTYLKLRNFAKETVFSFKKVNLKKTEFPQIINIETSILCNAKCPMCPHKEIKRERNMPFSLVKKIINEASNYKIKEIHPFNYGEPFLYKKFVETLKYIRKKIPSCKIFIYSNGAAMTNGQMEEIIKNNLLDKVNFSLDAITPKTFKIMRGLDYQTTIKKVRKFLELNKKYGNKIKISVSFVINEQNQRELMSFRKFWRDKARIHIGVDDGRGGKPFINKASKKPCSWPFNRTVILTTGDVVICCVDAKGKLIVGNVKEKTLKEIWDSPIYENIRKLHVSGKKSNIELCKNCYVRY